MITESSSGKAATAFSHLSYFWNSDKTMLMAKGTGIAKDSSNHMLSYVLSGSLSLDNNQLLVNIETGVFADLTQQIDDITLTCTYNKVGAR